MSVTIDRDTSRPRHLWEARYYQPGSHPLIVDKPWPSYSTVCNLHSNAPAFAAAAAKLNSEYYAKSFLEFAEIITPEDAIGIVQDTGHYRRQWKEAAEAGTAMHELFQSIVTGKTTPECFDITDDGAKTVLAITKWKHMREYEQVSGEEIIADGRHNTAGRYDSFGLAKLKRVRKNVLVDLKTGKSVKPSSFMQVAGYWAALDNTVDKIDYAIILHAPIGCDEVKEHILHRKELKEHYKAFLAIRKLWDWHEKYGELK